MSGVAGLYNVPSIQEELHTWSFIHASHHRDINRLLYQLLGETVAEFIIDPFNPADSGDWLNNHQAMHTQIDAHIGISGYNLLAVDMTDENQFGGWVFLNADEHFKIANILGIG